MDETYFAFKDVHDGLQTITSAFEGLKIQHELPRGTADGVNQKFRVENEPSFMSINGVIKIPGVDYNIYKGLVTFVVVPPINAVIRSHYL